MPIAKANPTTGILISDVLKASAETYAHETSYKSIAKALCTWYAREYGEELRVEGLQMGVIIRYRQWCAGRVKPRTIAQRMSALRWLGQQLVAKGLVEIDPFQEGTRR